MTVGAAAGAADPAVDASGSARAAGAAVSSGSAVRRAGCAGLRSKKLSSTDLAGPAQSAQPEAGTSLAPGGGAPGKRPRAPVQVAKAGLEARRGAGPGGGNRGRRRDRHGCRRGAEAEPPASAAADARPRRAVHVRRLRLQRCATGARAQLHARG